MTAVCSSSSEPVLVLGGGLMGLAIAHQLARKGIAVTVLSRRRSEAAGFVAAGMLAPHAEGLSGPLLQLGQLSLGRVPSWVAQIEADSGLPCGLRSTGIVVPFRCDKERDLYPTAALANHWIADSWNRNSLEWPLSGPLGFSSPKTDKSTTDASSGERLCRPRCAVPRRSGGAGATARPRPTERCPHEGLERNLVHPVLQPSHAL